MRIMRKFVTLLLSVFLLFSGSFLTGCSKKGSEDNSQSTTASKSESKKDNKKDSNKDNKKDKKKDNEDEDKQKKDDEDDKNDKKDKNKNSDANVQKLLDSMKLTNKADSVEAEIITTTEIGGTDIEVKMNMQAVDLKGDTKAKIVMETFGMEQEFYITIINGKTTIYIEDPISGNYIATESGDVQMTGVDFTESFDTFVGIIEENPELISMKSDNTYELTIPKERTEEIYKQLTKQEAVASFDELTVEYVIGDDGYISNYNMVAESSGMSLEMKCSYKNFNKKFNIQIPKVTK